MKVCAISIHSLVGRSKNREMTKYDSDCPL